MPEAVDGGCRYTLYVSGDAAAVADPGLVDALDALLSRNPQYAYCRRLGQLHRPRAVCARGDAYAAYADRLTRAGQRLGDIKPMALSPLDGWTAVLERSGDVSR
jgi:hypothetical protein